MFTPTFWRSTAERAVKTFCQTLVALFWAGGIGILNAPWTMALSTAGMAAVLSVLSSVGSTRVGTPDDPSAVPLAVERPLPARTQLREAA